MSALLIGLPRFVVTPCGSQHLPQLRARADLRETLEDPPDGRCLYLVHHELAISHVVAERHAATHPHAAGAGGRKFVANALVCVAILGLAPAAFAKPKWPQSEDDLKGPQPLPAQQAPDAPRC